MENISISLNAVLPMFISVGIGYVAKRKKLISESAAKQTNTLCFYCLMSVLLFYNIYSADLRSAFNWRMILFCICGILMEFLLAVLLVLRIEKNLPARGVIVQAFSRCNVLLLGLPIATSLFGDTVAGQITLLLTIQTPVANILAVLALELFRGGKPHPQKIVRDIVTNPLIVGTFAGILIALSDLRLPTVLESAVRSVANAATPMTLIVLGAYLDFRKLRGSIRNLLLCTAFRLIIAPALALSLAALLGFQGVTLCGILLIFATPVPVASYTMAAQMDGDADLAGGIVMLTTGLSCITLFFWVWLMKTLGLF